MSRVLLIVSLVLNAILLNFLQQAKHKPRPIEALEHEQPEEPPLTLAPPPPEAHPPAPPVPHRNVVTRATDFLKAIPPLVWLISALTLGALGQLAFLEKPDPSMLGVVWYVFGIVAFVAAVKSARRRVSRSRGAINVLQSPSNIWRGIALVAAILSSIYLLGVLIVNPPTADYTTAFVIWIVTIVLYVVAVAPPRRRAAGVRLWSRARDWRMIVLVAAIVLAGLLLRVWQLGTIPGTLAGDEGAQGYEALRIIAGELRNPFVTGWTSVPTMSFFFTVPFIQSIGNTAVGLRLPWALIGSATVLIVFFLVKRLKGPALGLMTATLLAGYHYHIHFSRLGSNQIADPFFVSLMLLFLYRAIDHNHARDWALCGVVTGVAQYAYTGARFTAILLVFLLAFFLLRDRARFWQTHRKGIVILLGATLISAAPMIQHAIRFPNDYDGRVNQVGIIQSGWLEREQTLRGQGALPILLDQFRRSALAFNAYADRTVWYGSAEPLLDFPGGILFLIGLGYATLHMGDRRQMPMVAWWWGVAILGGMLTESPPSSQRLIAMAVPTMFFVALTLQHIAQIAHSTWREISPRAMRLAIALGVLALCVSSTYTYFVDFTPTRLYGGPNALLATEFGRFAKAVLGPDWRVYFFGLPRMYWGLGTFTYLLPEIEGVDIDQPLTAPPGADFIKIDKQVAFLFVPERRDELDWLRQTFPNGTLNDIRSPIEDKVLFTVYRIDTSASH